MVSTVRPAYFLQSPPTISQLLGLVTEFGDLLKTASPEERHLSLALAAQFGHVGIVRSLLDVGEDPDRYNPPGGHSHATPLHQASGAGHEAVVRLLVERGARVDLKDVLWHATPAEWAGHEGKTELEGYLRESEGSETPAPERISEKR
jgi:ankyrin repeat protein